MSYHKFDDLDCEYWPISTETVQRKAAVSIAATAKTRAVRGVDMDKKWRHLKKTDLQAECAWKTHFSGRPIQRESDRAILFSGVNRVKSLPG